MLLRTHTVPVAPTQAQTDRQAPTHTHKHTHSQTGKRTPALAVLFFTDSSFFFNAFVMCLELDAGAGLTGWRCRHLSLLQLSLLTSPLFCCNFTELQLLWRWRWQMPSSWSLIGIVNASVFHNHTNKKSLEIHRALCRIKSMCKIKNNNNNNNTAL